MLNTFVNKQGGTAERLKRLFLLAALILLTGAPGASSSGSGIGVYTEGADQLEIASDSGFTAPTTEFAAGSTVYVRVTTTRVSGVGGGSQIVLNDHAGVQVASGSWTQTSPSSPYQFTAELVVPDPATKYLEVRGLVKTGPNRFGFNETITITGLDQDVRLFRDAARTLEAHAFTLGETIYIRAYGSGAVYSEAQTGAASQVLNDFTDSIVNSWDAPISVIQAANLYDYELTLPSVGIADEWWYPLNLLLVDAGGATIADVGTMIEVDETPPETYITDPLGGAALGGAQKLIVGTAVNNIAIADVGVAITRDLDGLYWSGGTSTWTVGAVWNAGTITAGHGTPSASWQYSWVLPADNGGGYTIQARAADEAILMDPTPVSVAVTVDNVGLSVGDFRIDDGAPYATTTSVVLKSDVTNAQDMRFAETTAALGGAGYASYDTTAVFSLTGADGTKTVFAQYRDSGLTETTDTIFDQIVLDTNAPVVTSNTPAADTEGVPQETTVSVVLFDANGLDENTVNGSNFYLTDDQGDIISSALAFDAGESRATLVPLSTLGRGRSYTAYVTPGITDMAGNTLDTTFSWSFVSILPHTRGPFPEDTDIIDIAADASFTTQTTEFALGDTVYVRVTTNRVTESRGASGLDLLTFTGTNITSANWVQTSVVAPYVFESSVTISTDTVEYRHLEGFITDTVEDFVFSETIEIAGISQHFHAHQDSSYTTEGFTFEPGETMYLSVNGSGVEYSAAKTGTNSQRLHDFADNTLNTWNAPAVTRDGDLYTFPLTLPVGGLIDGWWYVVRVMLTGTDNSTIADIGRFVQIDSVEPQTSITDPTGGTLAGTSKLITGTATDTVAVSAVQVSIEREADNFWWDGSSWIFGQAFVSSIITAGQDTTSAAWQYTWALPSSNNETYTIYAKARDAADHEDLTPASVAVTVDSIPPVINSLAINNEATYTVSTTVTVESSVTGASEMRFAESLGSLGAQTYQAYDTTHTFVFTLGDGTKTVYSQFKDSIGNVTVAGSIGSFDAIVLDTQAPVVASTDPPDLATLVSTTKTVTVDFTEANGVDPNTLANDDTEPGSTFYLKEGANWTTATVSYDPVLKRASLDPVSALSQGTTYTAYLTTGVTDLAGNALGSGYSWSFSTADSAPPDTVITDPLGGTLTGPAKLILGTAADNSSVSTVTVSITRDSDGYYWNETTWTASAAWNTAVITAGQDTTAASWQYSWVLPSDNGGGYSISARSADSAANTDPTPATVAVNVDNIAPAITSFLISNDATYTNSTTVTLNNSASGAVDMRFGETTATLLIAAYGSYNTTAAFSLSAADGTRTVYSQFKDVAGNETTPAIIGSFDAIILDTSAPVVASTDPPDLAALVPTTKTVTVDFTEANGIDPSTIANDDTELGSTFYLKEGTNWTTATVSYDPALKRASLLPSAVLSDATTYTAYLTTGVTDLAGNALGTPYSWSFSTSGIFTHAPGDPTNLAVEAADMVNLLTWTAVTPASDSGGDFDPPTQGGYNIYRSATETGPWTQANATTVTTTTFADPSDGSPPRGVFFYVVRAIDAAGSESGDSNSDDNGNVDMSRSTDTSATVLMRSANDFIDLSVPAQGAATTLTISTPLSYPGGISPLTLVYQFEPTGTTLSPSATVTFKTLGDPTDLLIAANRGSGWQILSAGNYTYDVASQTVSYDGIDQFSHYTVVDSSLTPPHGGYLPTTTLCEVCHILHGDPTAGLQRERRFLRAEEDSAFAVFAGSWSDVAGGGRSSNTATVSATAGDQVDLFFRGKEVGLRVTETSGSGQARIYIDGVVQEDIDLYRSVDRYQALLFSEAALLNADHTLTVEVLGTKNASSTGFAVEVDAFDVIKLKDMGLTADDEKAVCYVCHDGTGSAFDISTQFAETSGVPVPVSSHPVAVGTILCSDCHSPHASGEDWDADHDANEAVRLLRSDFQTYLGFVVVEQNTWLDTPEPADLIFGVPEQRKVLAPYEACASCHGVGSSLPGGNITEFYDNGGTKHDSTATVPAGTKANIACTSCHEWHVSDLPALLESTISGSAVTGNDNSVCYACHTENKITAYGDATPTGDIHGANESTQTTASPGLFAPYSYRDPQIQCTVCHDPHGTGNLLWIPETVNSTGPISVNSTAAPDWAEMDSLCQACHTTTHNPNTVCTDCHFHGANEDATTTTRF